MTHLTTTSAAAHEVLTTIFRLVSNYNAFRVQYLNAKSNYAEYPELIKNALSLYIEAEKQVNEFASDLGANWADSTNDNIDFLSNITESVLVSEKWTMEGSQNYSSDFDWTAEPEITVYESTVYQKVCGIESWKAYNDHEGTLSRAAMFDHCPTQEECEGYFMTPKQYEQC